MTLSELVTKVFLTDIKPEDISLISTNCLIYIIDYKTNPTNTTWWRIFCDDRPTELILNCTLIHGNLSFFKSHKGHYHSMTDKFLDSFNILIKNITHSENEWEIEYY